MKTFFCGLAAVFAVGLVQADTYQVELNAAVGQGEISGEVISYDYDTTSFDGNFYFSAVDTSKGPYREAAFLSKSSGIRLSYSTIEYVSTGDALFDVNLDLNLTDVEVRYVSANGIILEASYQKTKAEFDFGLIDTQSNESDEYSIAAGKYLSDNADIVFRYTNASDIELDTYGIDYHGVYPANGSNTWGIDFALNYLNGEDDSATNINLGATFYISDNFGIGAALDHTADDDDTQTISLEAEYFFTPSFSGSVLYSMQDQENEEFDLLAIGLTARF